MQFFNLELDLTNLYLPNRFEFQNLFEFCVEFIELSSSILQKKLVEMFLTDVVIAFLVHLVVSLFNLLQNLEFILTWSRHRVVSPLTHFNRYKTALG